MEPGTPAESRPVEQDQFHLWVRRRRESVSLRLATSPDNPSRTAALYPFTWTEYLLGSTPLILESAAFSPLLPGEAPERSLPLYLVVFRASNPTPDSLEAALMLTWECGWPEPIPDSTFDFQHDNLCLTGSLGSPGRPNRQGIAVPDLHYMGIYQQGIEPWEPRSERDELCKVVEDFTDDGELDPRVVRATPHGAAAWVKFDLEPGETKEIPFVIAWHFPTYETGIAVGAERRYTQYLGRYRPDNAIVWLAEQAVQHYGAETANYRYWMQQLSDWQAGLGDNAADVCGALDSVVGAGTIWPVDRPLELARSVPPAQQALASTVWPEIAP